MIRSCRLIYHQSRSSNSLLLKIFTRTNTSQNDKSKKLKYTKMAVDRSGLLGQANYDSYKPYDEINSDLSSKESISNALPKEELSPLAKDLLSYIELRGPITVHDYMSQCSNHLIHGYYQQKKDKELIGTQGDFITSPEITQLFGELIGIWIISMWISMDKPSKINLIELGPGKGTLMKDILRVIEKFPSFQNAVHIHLVELSQVLRLKQYNQFNIGNIDETMNKSSVDKKTIEDSYCYQTSAGLNVSWYSFLYQVPSDAPVIIIGQEFLDAFPVHQFTYTVKGWREKLVDINRIIGTKQNRKQPLSETSSTKDVVNIIHDKSTVTEVSNEAAIQKFSHHFRFVISPTETPAIKSLLSSSNKDTLSKRSSLILSPQENVAPISASSLGVVKPKVGDCIEISPLSIAMSEDIATRVVKSGGAALLIDYGEDFTQGDSLRAFQNHKQIHVLSQPGFADLTADVDFSMCKKAAINKGANVPNIITQGEFLMQMGILSRVEQLLELDETTDEQANDLVNSFKYLVEPQHMGKKFKVMSIVDPKISEITGF